MKRRKIYAGFIAAIISMPLSGYGNVTEWYWDYVWKEIDENTYTSNKVKDRKSMFKLYKLTREGNFEYKYFSSFDEREEEYIYFKYGELIAQIESEPYYLNKLIFKIRVYLNNIINYKTIREV